MNIGVAASKFLRMRRTFAGISSNLPEKLVSPKWWRCFLFFKRLHKRSCYWCVTSKKYD